MHPQTIMLRPPYFTVTTVQAGTQSSARLLRTLTFARTGYSWKLDSSNHRIFAQCALLCFSVISSFFQKSPTNSSGCTLDPWLLRPLSLQFWSCFLPVGSTQAKQNTVVSCCTAPGLPTLRFVFQATRLLKSFNDNPSCRVPTSASCSNLTIAASIFMEHLHLHTGWERHVPRLRHFYV